MLCEGEKRGHEGSRQGVLLEGHQEGAQSQGMGVRRPGAAGHEGVGPAGIAAGRHRLANVDADQTEASSGRGNVLEIEMGKLEAKTRAKERRSPTSPIRRSKNRAGIIESSVKTCRECGEEYCFGEFCGDVLYDSFVRVTITSQQPKIKVSADTEAIIANMDRKKKRKKTRKKRIKSKSRTSKKSARLLVNGKARKSMSELETKSAKASRPQDSGQSEKPAKQFKRKCSKYTKKGVLRK
ncbi:PREDICTED: uncharacterized protein LOC106745365 isoform X2 [Dinoponera quadriceps]|uniref:Uncharacterized protein LOC106745365 isoform X2 n=1 Tax=Dinoponera quadriceps TaxID=609295 RepID=A0A6P3XDZ1_DINQU|nr:PREDICTED: uncharacterized protein LOC106745365 isoform X2 [Dinoponera quadriceps]